MESRKDKDKGPPLLRAHEMGVDDMEGEPRRTGSGDEARPAEKSAPAWGLDGIDATRSHAGFGTACTAARRAGSETSGGRPRPLLRRGSRRRPSPPEAHVAASHAKRQRPSGGKQSGARGVPGVSVRRVAHLRVRKMLPARHRGLRGRAVERGRGIPAATRPLPRRCGHALACPFTTPIHTHTARELPRT